jgi:hypothetical protein
VSGMSSLFTSDFYEVAASRLDEEGIFCQWFHYYDLTLADVKVQIRTFCARFPEVSLWLVPPRPAREGERVVPIGDILLIGSRKAVSPDWRRISRAVSDPAIRDDLQRAGVEDGVAFLCSRVAGQEDLLRLCAGAELNTDDHPLIELAAPRGLYAAQGRVLEDQLAINAALANCAADPVPPVEGYPPFFASATAAERADALDSLAQACERFLQPERARRLWDAARSPAPGR